MAILIRTYECLLFKSSLIDIINSCQLVYADIDSVFLKKNGVSLEDFECVKEILAKETGLPITLENCYKFLLLLPLEADEKMEALKHYFGITVRDARAKMKQNF